MRNTNLFRAASGGVYRRLIQVRRALKTSVVQLLPRTRASDGERAQATRGFKAVGPLENSYSSNFILLLQGNVEFVCFYMHVFT